MRTRRTVTAPYGDVGLPIVDPDDIAAVAATALLEDGHTGRTYELTGPALSTPRDRARDLGAALGITIEFVEQTPAEARAEMLHVMPEPVVDGTLAILGRPTAAEQRVSPDVEKILSRPPRPFATWARSHAGAFQETR